MLTIRNNTRKGCDVRISLKDLRPNPFRNVAHYPIDRAKVDALKRSIKDTSFWDNLLARKAPGKPGLYEIAYGIHRLTALKELHVEHVEIPVRDLDDTTMVLIMAHENEEEWSATASVEQETIRTIVEAYGAGKIKLPKADNMARGLRYAPSFVPLSSGHQGDKSLSYTTTTLAKFLGWGEKKIEAILATLSTEEKGLIDREDSEGLTTHQADMVARQVRRVEQTIGKPDVAKAIGKRLAAGMRTATGRRPGVGGKPAGQHQAVTYHGARAAADEMMTPHLPRKPKEYPPAGKAIPDLAKQIMDILQREDPRSQKIAQVAAVKHELHEKDVAMLAGALKGLAKRALAAAESLQLFEVVES